MNTDIVWSNLLNELKIKTIKQFLIMKIIIDEINNSNFMIRQSGERMAMNTPIQGTAADILKMAMIEIDKRFEKEKIKSDMLLQIHNHLFLYNQNQFHFL